MDDTYQGMERCRSGRKDYGLIRSMKSRSTRIILLFGLLPFWFILCRAFDSHTIRLGIPLTLLVPLFLFLLAFMILSKRIMNALGVLLIIPIFFSACLAISDFGFFEQRSLMTAFPKSLPPSARFLLGTDYEGRDILSTIVIGGLNAYLVAALSTLVALLTGIPAGLLLTVKNTVVRGVASVITQFFEIIPQLFFVLIVLGVFNFWSAASAGTRLIAAYAIPMAGFAIGISALPSIARIVESRVSQLQGRRFVAALQSSNVSGTRILWYNILWKNCISEIVIQATFLFGATILIESALGYAFEIGFGELGTGGYLSWGKILAESRSAILFADSTWIVVFPIMVTIMSILGVNIIGDSLAKHMGSES